MSQLLSYSESEKLYRLNEPKVSVKLYQLNEPKRKVYVTMELMVQCMNQYSSLSWYSTLFELSMYVLNYFSNCLCISQTESQCICCIFCELKVLLKFAKLSLNANGPNASCFDMLFVMVRL